MVPPPDMLDLRAFTSEKPHHYRAQARRILSLHKVFMETEDFYCPRTRHMKSKEPLQVLQGLLPHLCGAICFHCFHFASFLQTEAMKSSNTVLRYCKMCATLIPPHLIIVLNPAMKNLQIIGMHFYTFLPVQYNK